MADGEGAELLADKIWELLTYFNNKEADSEANNPTLHSENEKKSINDRLIASFQDTEDAVDAAIERERAGETITASADGVETERPEALPDPLSEDNLDDPESFLANMTAIKTSQKIKEPETQAEEPANEDEPVHAEQSVVQEVSPEPMPVAAPPTEDGSAHQQPEVDMSGGRLINISVVRVKPNPYQPRKMMGEKEISDLSQNIKELGVLQPILVKEDGDSYQLIAGERRLRAAQRAGLTDIPAVVIEVDPIKQQVMALAENIQRKNLSSVEEAVCLEDILAKTGWSQTELARRTGRSQASIANKLRLLRLDSSVQDLVISGKLGERQARSLLSLSIEEQRALAQRAVDEDLSAHALEQLAENWNADKKQTKQQQKRESDLPEGPAGVLFRDLASLIKKHKNKGVPAQWKVKKMDNESLVVEIEVDLTYGQESGTELEK